jgi:hypothetical protein
LGIHRKRRGLVQGVEIPLGIVAASRKDSRPTAVQDRI